MGEVVLSGYYGFDNAGDEAVLFCILQSLRRLSPGLQVTVLSGNPEATSRSFGVDAVDRWRPDKVMAALRHARLLVSGGGSLLQDVTGPGSILYYLGVVEAARCLGIRTMFYAQGIGPLKGRWSRRAVARAAKKADLVTVRDAGSADLLNALGVRSPRIMVTADPVFALDLKDNWLEAGWEALNSVGVNKERGPVASFVLRPWPELGTLELQAVAGAARFLVLEGWQVVFIPFQKSVDLPPNLHAAHLAGMLDKVLPDSLPLETLFGVCSCVELMVGMRLHSLIMGAMGGAALVGISYDPKVDWLLQGLGEDPPLALARLRETNLEKRMAAVLGTLNKHKDLVNISVAAMRELARQNTRLALELLDGGKAD